MPVILWWRLFCTACNIFPRRDMSNFPSRRDSVDSSGRNGSSSLHYLLSLRISYSPISLAIQFNCFLYFSNPNLSFQIQSNPCAQWAVSIDMTHQNAARWFANLKTPLKFLFYLGFFASILFTFCLVMFWLRHETKSLNIPIIIGTTYQISRPAKQRVSYTNYNNYEL